MFFSTEAVRMRFGYREQDMTNMWTTIRTSLVQKVCDIRKSNKRNSQQQVTPEQNQNASTEQASNTTMDNVTNSPI